VKIELSLGRGFIFHCPRGSENLTFFDMLSERPPEHPRGLIFGLPGVQNGSFWGPFGEPWGVKREEKKEENLTPRDPKMEPKSL